MNGDDAEMGPIEIPVRMDQLPPGTRLWLATLTPEKIARMRRTDKLADDIEDVRKVGKWLFYLVVGALLFSGQIVDAVDRVASWIGKLVK